ncbi:MAG: 50S ribosomal protein L10 [Candidatus Diapherotrites archaeon]|nr:50S ribosomal protein L10 [Candidatus Diapherotrites archaeon]MDZ4256762.1 50S ribosomal protein L10 [archaeon]
MTRHTRAWKEGEVTRLVTLAKEYPVIAVADLKDFPANLYGSLKTRLAGKAVVTVSKRKMMHRALEQAGVESKLKENVQGNAALIFSRVNPFELFSLIKQSSGKVSARVGQLAPEDITIPAGDTGLPPGPALSDLKAAGLVVKVQGATIAIVSDKLVAKKGEPISAPVANVLGKLGIKPIRLRLNVMSALEGNQLYPANLLDIDEDAVFASFIRAEQDAFNLAFNARVYSPRVTEMLLMQAFRESKAVALEGNILTPDTVGAVLGKAQRAAQGIKSQLPEEHG